MPRKQRRVRRPRRSGGQGSRTLRVPFHTMPNQALAGGLAAQVMAPQAGISDRLASIADCYDMYRLVKLRYRIRVDSTTSTVQAAMAFFPGIHTTVPSSITIMGDNPYTSLRDQNDTVILPWTNVPRGILCGEQPWYKSQKATVTADDSVPGQLLFIGTGTDNILYEMDGVYEFRGEVDTADTPLNPAYFQARLDLLHKRVANWHKALELERDAMRKLLTYARPDAPLLTGLQWPAPKKPP